MVFFVLLFVFIVLLFVFLMLLMMFLMLLMMFLMLFVMFLMLFVMFLMLFVMFLMLLMMFLMLLMVFPMLLRMFLMMFLVISMMMVIMVTPVPDVPVHDSLVNDGRSTHHPLHVCVGGGSRGLEKGGKLYSAGIFKTSMRARNRVGIGLLYPPARLYSLAELVPWNRFVDLHVENLGLCTFTWHVNKRIDCQRLARLLCPADQNIG
jgi:hypothetical protein